MTNETYHYTESGLDDVYLANGYDFIETGAGKSVRIHDIDGLHEAIAHFLIRERKILSGSEIRFLRHELLMSQNTLANILDVTEQTVRRWEQGRQQIPRSADAVLRQVYFEHDSKSSKMTEILQRIADIEDDIDRMVCFENNSESEWDVIDQAA